MCYRFAQFVNNFGRDEMNLLAWPKGVLSERTISVAEGCDKWQRDHGRSRIFTLKMPQLFVDRMVLEP